MSSVQERETAAMTGFPVGKKAFEGLDEVFLQFAAIRQIVRSRK
jgi:hypothetical protein